MNMSEADQLVRYSRQGLWIALVLIVLLGAGGAAMIGFPESGAAHLARSIWMLLPIVIVLALAALKSVARGARTDPRGAPMKAMLNDELRQHSLKRAYRNAFFAMMIVQPLLAFAPAWMALVHPTAVMACLTITAGMAVMFASLLYFDR